MTASSWLAPLPPTVAIEIASHRVTVVGIAPGGKALTLSSQATVPLPEGAIMPALAGTNIARPDIVTDALRSALEQAGLVSARRAALVIPDSVARVSLLPFEQLPERTSDFDKLVRLQLRKPTPFALEDAQISYFVASRDDRGALVATVVARRDVVSQYEGIVAAAGIHAGIVDLASLNVMNAVIGAGAAMEGDWLLVHLAAEATTLAILRGQQLLFYRHRTAVDEEPLGALVHQTAMYHEDRLGGAEFSHVWLSGAGSAADIARSEISERLRVPAEAVDITGAVNIRDRIVASPEVLDALVAPIGVLIRERRAA